jgi:hypothetical protein
MFAQFSQHLVLQVFAERQSELVGMASVHSLNIACFQTSIWDETLYKVIRFNFTYLVSRITNSFVSIFPDRPGHKSSMR